MIISYRPGTRKRTVVAMLSPRKEIMGVIGASGFKPVRGVRVPPLMLASIKRRIAGK